VAAPGLSDVPSHSSPSPRLPLRGAAQSEDGDTNVRVAVRCRPLSRTETAAGGASCFEVRSGHAVLKHPGDGSEYEFIFDHTYDMTATQAQVYEDNGSPLLDKAFGGFNSACRRGRGGAGCCCGV
jgi:hypothetical protein